MMMALAAAPGAHRQHSITAPKDESLGEKVAVAGAFLAAVLAVLFLG